MALAPLFTLGPGSWVISCPRTLISISRVPGVQRSLGHSMLSLQQNSGSTALLPCALAPWRQHTCGNSLWVADIHSLAWGDLHPRQTLNQKQVEHHEECLVPPGAD